MKIGEYETHPAADVFPLLDADAFEELRSDIEEHGLREPIWRTEIDGKLYLLDGRNRLMACQQADVEPSFRDYEGDSPAAFVVSLNLQRRHLTASQRAAAGVLLLPVFEAEARRRQGRRTDLSDDAETSGSREPEVERARDHAAEQVGSSGSSIWRAKQVHDQDPELFELVREGRVEVGTAEKALKAGADVRDRFMDLVLQNDVPGPKALADAKREAKREEARRNLEDVSRREAAEAEGVYDVVVLDPPWPMQKIDRDERPNQAEFDYPTMTEEELADLHVPCADDCHVWVWTTQKFLPMALRLLDSWDLRYVCTFVWHKPGGFQPVNLPQYNCEFALYARRGSPEFLDTKNLPTCFEAQRGKHSEKPEAFYEMVRRVTAGRRLDMFNRRQIEGFDAWGKEAWADAG